ncbi:hypothetical protein E2C01_038908 [Portunus trituberculatus]|uniref:Uncharacterized protein n=1 Tax=Portunus trituberculatus TaxID=210409 RepID=A0A5B7FIE7_PORTR|nr:hypothetical protein [Portunus trituberculatus]
MNEVAIMWKSVLQFAKHSFINRKYQNLSNSNSPSDFWHLVKNITNTFTSSSFPPLFHPDGTITISSVSKAELSSETSAKNSTLDDSGLVLPSPPSYYFISPIKILHDVFCTFGTAPKRIQAYCASNPSILLSGSIYSHALPLSLADNSCNGDTIRRFESPAVSRKPTGLPQKKFWDTCGIQIKIKIKPLMDKTCTTHSPVQNNNSISNSSVFPRSTYHQNALQCGLAFLRRPGSLLLSK